jgi:hypothetical protein
MQKKEEMIQVIEKELKKNSKYLLDHKGSFIHALQSSSVLYGPESEGLLMAGPARYWKEGRINSRIHSDPKPKMID